MKRFLRSIAFAGLALILASGITFAQQAPTVQQSGTRLDSATALFAPTPSINQSQTTITIPASSGNCAYIDSLVLSLGMDATGTTGVQTFTSTNLGGLAWSFFPVVIATSPSAPYFAQQMVGASPIKSASCGTATTVVSPAQATHNSYPMFVAFHYSP